MGITSKLTQNYLAFYNIIKIKLNYNYIYYTLICLTTKMLKQIKKAVPCVNKEVACPFCPGVAVSVIPPSVVSGFLVVVLVVDFLVVVGGVSVGMPGHPAAQSSQAP